MALARPLWLAAGLVLGLTWAIRAVDPLDVSSDLDSSVVSAELKVSNLKANGPFHEVSFDVETDVVARIFEDKNLRVKRRVDQSYSATGPWHPACLTSELFKHPVTGNVTDNSFIYDAKADTLNFRALPFPSGWANIKRVYALPYVPHQPMYFRAVLIAPSGAESYSQTVGPDEPAIQLEPAPDKGGAIHLKPRDPFGLATIGGFIGSANRMFRATDVPIAFIWDGKNHLNWARSSAAGANSGRFQLMLPLSYGEHQLTVHSIVMGKSVSVTEKVVIEPADGAQVSPARPPEVMANFQFMLGHLPDAAAIARGAGTSRHEFTRSLSRLLYDRIKPGHTEVAAEFWNQAAAHYQQRTGQALLSAISNPAGLAYPDSQQDDRIGAKSAMDIALCLGMIRWRQGKMAEAAASFKLRTDIQEFGLKNNVKEFFESTFYGGKPVYRTGIYYTAEALAAAGDREGASAAYDRYVEEYKLWARQQNNRVTDESIDKSLAENWPSWHLRQPVDRLSREAMQEVLASPDLAPMPVKPVDFRDLGPGIRLLGVDAAFGASGKPADAPAALPVVTAPMPVNPAGVPPALVAPLPMPASAAVPVDAAGPLQQARAASQKGDVPAAMAAYQQALAANPKDAAALQERALLGLWSNQLPVALSDFRALAQINPQDKQIRKLRALTEIILGDPQVADVESAALLAQDPKDAQFLLLRGQSLMRLGRNDQALSLFQQARAVDPQIFTGLYQQGYEFLRRGVPQVAYTQLTTVAWADPQNSGVYYGIGQAAAQLGWRDIAVQSLERFLRMDSTSPFAEAARQQLQQLRAKP